MTPRMAATQSKIRLIGIFLSVVVLILTFQFFRARPNDAASSTVSQAETTDPAMFMGLRHATPHEIHTVLPEAIGKPVLLEFGSRLCHDCQRLAPVVDALQPKYSGIYFRKVDVLTDHDKAPALLRTFKPVTVPLLVFIGADGQIRNVLYNYQPPETVDAALKRLQLNGSHPQTATKPIKKAF
jgi:thiol:disulfide interchange protein